MKKFILVILIIFVITGLTFFVLTKSTKTQNNLTDKQGQLTEDTSIINQPTTLFYSDSCPHCRRVEAFIENNNIKQKISFIEKEISKNETNKNDLIQKAKQCNLPLNEIGVPFLWDGKKCIIGDENIIKFFEKKING